jgi:hexosaminidase
MIPIIPLPTKWSQSKGSFTFSSDVKILNTKQLGDLAEYLNEWISTIFGFNLEQTNSESSQKKIEFKLDSSLGRLGAEGYRLEIAPNSISIQSDSVQGIFYGIQSLLQALLSARGSYDLKLPLILIEDFPRFKWRGFMLDVSRHYHPIETIKKLIQVMALLKMNRFHWHFNDDQGWRIEIPEFPLLIEIGSKRKNTQIGGFLSRKYRGESYQGFYTQEDVREIIQFAQKRYIQVIPELELPGHCSAVIASYPELSCRGRKVEVKTKSGIFKDVFCPGKESTFTFIEDILNKLIELFPSDTIHIGGDETPKGRWKECIDCQSRIKNENLKNEEGLYNYFINRIVSFLKSRGKECVGWNQILSPSLDKSVITQWWMGKKRDLAKNLKQGRKIVSSSISHSYLDYNYLLFPMHRFYNHEPIPKKLEREYHDNILGIEAALWTEWVPNLERLGWQTFPRLIASAEIGWTQRNLQNYKNFKQRVSIMFEFLKILEIPYAEMKDVDPSFLKRLLQFYKWFKWPKV